ncbi:hypothetical protein ACA910_006594 [Epithemia clementina (nom. ined.)]
MDIGTPLSAMVQPEQSTDSKTVDTTTVGTLGSVSKSSEKRKPPPNVPRKAHTSSSEIKKKPKQGVGTPPGRKAKGKKENTATAAPSDTDDDNYADGCLDNDGNN